MPRTAAFALFLKGQATLRPLLQDRFVAWNAISDELFLVSVREAQNAALFRRDVEDRPLAAILRDLLSIVAERQAIPSSAAEPWIATAFDVRWEAFLAFASAIPSDKTLKPDG
ncbi:hypothetical protein [Sphingobium sp.]|uniref:hypothetical protein n=1 Tax=Sphingobium sp. TaxID=1912891 RepID=UPI002C610840|nr:hypothetical protein [Sphingobium sp.]HUD94720.1 hypothetical protein [Sphingobium sp.]